MSDTGDFFDGFEAHTLLKHGILHAYTMSWAMKLLLARRYGRQLYVVDAFAGAGGDGAGNPGSPVIIARNALSATSKAFEMLSPGPRPAVKIFAIEKVEKTYLSLVERTRGFAATFPGMITVLHGELADYIDRIAAETQQAPTLYFLDPFGIKGLDASTYSKALAGPQNEIFALFGDLGANRLHAQITTARKSPDRVIDRVLQAPSLFPLDDAARIADAIQRAEVANRALDLSSPKSQGHLVRALGRDDCVEIVSAAAPEDRADKFVELFLDALARAGASTFVRIPMRADDMRRPYTLIHAAQSIAGTLAMKEAVSSGLTNAALTPQALQAMRRDLSIELEPLVRAYAEAYAGQSIRWTDNGGAGLKEIFLRHTPMFDFQAAELKALLTRMGILRRVARIQMCVFPAKP